MAKPELIDQTYFHTLWPKCKDYQEIKVPYRLGFMHHYRDTQTQDYAGTLKTIIDKSAYRYLPELVRCVEFKIKELNLRCPNVKNLSL